MESVNSQDIMSVLRNDEAGANQRDNSRRKSSSANICRARCDYSQMPPQISGERQHQQSCQRQAAGSHPIMTGIITRRKQVGDDAVSPVVILGNIHALAVSVPQNEKKISASKTARVDFR